MDLKEIKNDLYFKDNVGIEKGKKICYWNNAIFKEIISRNYAIIEFLFIELIQRYIDLYSRI